MTNTALLLCPKGALASYMAALPAWNLRSANNLQLCQERPVLSLQDQTNTLTNYLSAGTELEITKLCNSSDQATTLFATRAQSLSQHVQL